VRPAAASCAAMALQSSTSGSTCLLAKHACCSSSIGRLRYATHDCFVSLLTTVVITLPKHYGKLSHMWHRCWWSSCTDACFALAKLLQLCVSWCSTRLQIIAPPSVQRCLFDYCNTSSNRLLTNRACSVGYRVHEFWVIPQTWK